MTADLYKKKAAPCASPSSFCGARIGLLALFEYIALITDYD